MNTRYGSFPMISRLLDPVFLGLLIAFLGLLGWTLLQPRKLLLRWKYMTWTGFVFLWLCASPWFSNLLVRAIEPHPTDLSPLLDGTKASEKALVVLAGGKFNEYDFVPPPERLDDSTQARLFGAARIYQDHGPFGLIIVTGTGHPYVASMADTLVLFGLPRDPIVLEIQATDTDTNAKYSAEILKKHDVKQVVLVTSALHIPRSVAAFRKAGVDVLPAPVDYRGRQGWRLLPASKSLNLTARATHEILGRLEPW